MSEKQVAVVTGSNGDMGQAILQALEADGYRGVGIDLGDSGLGGFAYRRCDLLDLAALEATLAEIAGSFGLVRVLVNNAGIFTGKRFLEATPETYDRTFGVNTRGLFFATQYVVKALLAAGQTGTIVNIASVSGEMGSPVIDYSGSKAAVIMMTKSLGKQLGPHGIRVNAVAPGTIETAMSRGLDAERKRELHAGIALRRAGIPREIADTVAFLASEKASYLTGATIDVNGGLF